MTDRRERRDGDLDDWFDEPEPPPARRAARPRPRDPVLPADAATEVWFRDPQGAAAPESPLWQLVAGSGLRRVVALVAGIVVVLGLLLLLSQVFGGSSPGRTRTGTLAPRTATTPTTPQATPAAPTVPAPAGPLKPGDQGPAVKVLQRALASLGYSPGTIDGTYGPSTQQALARFQTFSKLTPDGVLGPLTVTALRNAVLGP